MTKKRNYKHIRFMEVAFYTETDGQNHINIYSKAKTQLGLFLSNFAHSPISTPDGRFSSVEGYWYWLNTNHPDRDRLRTLHGFKAKAAGREMRASDWNEEKEFKEKIKKAIYNKIFSNIPMAIALKKSTLPLTHYYDYKGKIVEPQDGKWVIEFIDELRNRLQSCTRLEYQVGDLFDAPKGVTLAHSCNSQGAMGKGIAADFKERFPQSYTSQKDACNRLGPRLLGSALVTEEGGYKIACLFTSDGYGRMVSSKEKILRNTSASIQQLLNHPEISEVWIPKINSGLFATPWEETEIAILRVLLLQPNKKVVVRTGSK